VQKLAKNQTDLNSCAKQELTLVERQMDEAYRELLSTTRDDTAAQAKIKAAQTAWVAYRDAFLEAMWPARDKQAEYGTAYPMQYGEVRLRLTRQQLVALRSLIKEYSPH
jgi:uncharacterized protein YecT (DUF1311 family)